MDESGGIEAKLRRRRGAEGLWVDGGNKQSPTAVYILTPSPDWSKLETSARKRKGREKRRKTMPEDTTSKRVKGSSAKRRFENLAKNYDFEGVRTEARGEAKRGRAYRL